MSYYNVIMPEAHQLYEERRLAIQEIQGKAPPFLGSEKALTADNVTIVKTLGGGDKFWKLEGPLGR